jgi:hypothetical protein
MKYKCNTSLDGYYCVCVWCTEGLSSLFEAAGYQVAQCHYVSRQTVNVKEDLCVERTFVQGKFVKTGTLTSPLLTQQCHSVTDS